MGFSIDPVLLAVAAALAAGRAALVLAAGGERVYEFPIAAAARSTRTIDTGLLRPGAYTLHAELHDEALAVIRH